MTSDNPPFDLVVFGATGFVGQLVCQYLLEQSDKEAFTWAIAGRSPDKLDQLATTLGSRAANLPRLMANANDEASLRKVCEQTRVVISTVGPYALYGEPLVKVCAATGTHYGDLTGEPQWIRRMLQRYEASAQASGAHIVHCCGFDSIPSDLGVYYLQQQAQQAFGEPCTQVKMRVIAAQGGVSGGTVASGVNLVKEATADRSLRAALKDPYLLCPDSDKTPNHPPTMIPVQFDKDFQEWVTPFVMAEMNTRVVLRSRYLQPQTYGPNFQYEEGILTRGGPIGWLVAQGLKVGLDAFTFAAALPPTRWVLENTVLPATGEGPSPEQQRQGYYDLRFIGRTASSKMMQVQVTGDRDPGYGSTSRILGQAGLSLAQDMPSLGQPGGFWTPAALLGESLIDRLQRNAGLTFKVL
jgi:short subunit dehydrogenase-like uncharacterized protein